MDERREAALHDLEGRLGHRFRDLSLLDRALTHTSFANEDLSGRTRHNEPLEFLGDSILGFIVADLLHRGDPEGGEGQKSKRRAHLVSAPSLASRAAELGLPELLQLGRGEEKTGGRKKTSLWANALEAVIAALHLDGGLEVAHGFVARAFGADLVGRGETSDYKSALQERLQARAEGVPDYVVAAEEGPSHRRRFRVRCLISGRTVSEGEGFSKKEAQQDAARRALESLGYSIQPPPRHTPPS
jgi:ribonuclease-3